MGEVLRAQKVAEPQLGRIGLELAGSGVNQPLD